MAATLLAARKLMPLLEQDDKPNMAQEFWTEQSNMLVSEFVDKVYLPEYVEKNLRPASLKQYTDVWNNHLKGRMGKLTLRSFRTATVSECLRTLRRRPG
jgi:hypothetical protein